MATGEFTPGVSPEQQETAPTEAPNPKPSMTLYDWLNVIGLAAVLLTFWGIFLYFEEKGIRIPPFRE